MSDRKLSENDLIELKAADELWPPKVLAAACRVMAREILALRAEVLVLREELGAGLETIRRRPLYRFKHTEE